MKFLIAILAASFSFSQALAAEKICFGMEENKGNWMLVDISPENVQVVRAGSKNVDKKMGYEVTEIAGELFPFTKELSGTYRYDMGSFKGGNGLMLVDASLVEEKKDVGNITLRADGDNGLLYIKYFCRDEAATATGSAEVKNLKDVIEEFNNNNIGYISTIGTKEDPFLIHSTVPSEIAYELYQFFGTDDEVDNYAQFQQTHWEESAAQAWESDGYMYGQIPYSEAEDYVKSGSLIDEVDLSAPEYKKAVSIFKQLENAKHLIYIVAPVGATPCGDIRLPAVIIIDLSTGKSYELSMDSSEC